MKLLPTFLLAGCIPVISACTVSQATLPKGSLAPPHTVQVVAKSDASGDARIRAALETGLLQRGLRGGGKPVTVEFEDSWYWDIVMYLRALNVRFIDTATGNPFGSVMWRQKGFHVYPSQEAAVAELLAELDKAGAFTPKAK